MFEWFMSLFRSDEENAKAYLLKGYAKLSKAYEYDLNCEAPNWRVFKAYHTVKGLIEESINS